MNVLLYRPNRAVLSLAAIVCVIMCSLGPTAGHDEAAVRAVDAPTRVIVRATAGTLRTVEAGARELGAAIDRDLGIIGGFSAVVSTAALSELKALPGVVSVSPDLVVHAMSASYSPTTDLGSPYNVTTRTGAQAYWRAGFTGKGVGVALIDSGVAPTSDMSANLVYGADLSFDSQASNLTNLDSFGHGTHMAGIIAGRSAGATSGAYVGDSSDFLGMAPDATLVSVKVADAHGATDVSQVIAAIDWVVQHRNDPGLNIRVLNLSYGTDTGQSYTIDPLAYAAEQAWKAGIFVVAAAGNAGFENIKTSSMTDPAYDPNIMAVGAADAAGTPKLSDDTVPSFSSTGNASRRPDMVAPGTHIVSLRAPGSLIDQTYAGTGAATDTLFRGSGTSQATAVISGAAALVTQQRPSITPDQMKSLLTGTAQTLKGMLREQQGAGELNLTNTLMAATPSVGASKYTASNGLGSIEASRGSTHLVQDGVALAGEQDVMGQTFDTATMANLEATGRSWSAGDWNGRTWTGSTWSSSAWSGRTWSGATWSGRSWSGRSWSDNSWSGRTWSGRSWSTGDWSANNWLGGPWADNAWADATWG